MNALELRIPPAVLVVLFALVMWLTAIVTPALRFPVPFRRVLASVLLVLGVAVIIAGLLSFRRAGTTINPLQPEAASTLVASGMYRFTRNPMYLGFVLLLAGWAAFLANALSALLVAGFVLYMNRFQIIPEERALSRLFGSTFSIYCQRVRRWL